MVNFKQQMMTDFNVQVPDELPMFEVEHLYNMAVIGRDVYKREISAITHEVEEHVKQLVLFKPWCTHA